MNTMQSSERTGRNWLWFGLMLAAVFLFLGLTAAPAPAQEEEVAAGDYPTDAERAAELEPKILEATRSGDAVAITVEIPAGADTFTTSGQPDRNWSNDPNIRLGFNTVNGLGAERIYLYFDVSSIPRNAQIQSAVIRMFQNNFSPVGDQPMPAASRFLTTSWDPNILTWNNYNPQWGSEIGSTTIPARTGWGEKNAPVSAIRDWVTGARTNNGFIIIGDETPRQRERVYTTLNANNGAYPRLLVTYTVVNDTTPPVASVEALPQFSRKPFTVRWSGTDDLSGIAWYDVEYRINRGNWIIWRAQVTTTSASFDLGNNNDLIEFRARAVDNAGNTQAWSSNPQAATTLDTVPPNASMNALPQFTFTESFEITWGPNEDPSRIAFYDVQYRRDDGPWENLLIQTTLANTTFTGAQNGSLYGFRVRAQDTAGNLQSWSDVPQAQTTISEGLPTATIIPISPSITNQLNFTVSWQGTAAPGATIASYDVEFRRNKAGWQTWQSGVATTTAIFTAPNDAIYDFRVRARDSVNRVGEWSNNPGSTKVVDTTAPFITPRVFVPITRD